MTDVSTPTGSALDGDVKYWRSLDQLENSPEFQAVVAREFPDGIAEAPALGDDVSRRGFLSAVAATVALAGLTSCRKPKTKILPFNKRPEGFKPGVPQVYATTLTRGGVGIGVLVKSSDGRPTKIEGNPDHPSSLGGSDARLQAELLQIYDPGRSRTAVGPGAHAAGDGDEHAPAAAHGHGAAGAADQVHEEFHKFWEETAKQLTLKKGAGLHVLMAPTTSPSLLDMVRKTQDALPAARFHAWDPIHRDEELAGAKVAFGRPVEAHTDFAKTDVIASFDCDFLALDGNNLRNARDWASRRRAPKVTGSGVTAANDSTLSRLYMFESCYSTTGTMADHRERLKPGEVVRALLALAAQLGVGKGGDLATALESHRTQDAWAARLAADLQGARGRSAVVVGPRLPAVAHAVAHAINAALDNLGKTVTFTALPESLQQGAVAGVQQLATALEANQVEVLVCLGTNPVYDAPADLHLDHLLHDKKPKTVIHLGLHRDETGMHADWHLPMAHELEAWGDARAHDGTVSFQQPLVEPLFGGVSPLEFVAQLSQQPRYDDVEFSKRDAAYGHHLVRDYWKTASGSAADFETWWLNALHAGLLADSRFAAESVNVDAAAVTTAVRAFKQTSGFEVLLRPCPKMWDGRYGNNSWMQELPDPLTKLTWDNAALLGIATAERLAVKNGDLLSIAANGQTLQIPAWILPGHAEECTTVYLGWGRTLADGKVARDTGFSGYRLRTTGSQWHAAGATVAKAAGQYRLVCTQEQGTMAGRAIVREATAATYAADKQWAPKMSPLDQAARTHGQVEKDVNKSLWQERFDPARNDPEVARSPYQWAMVIDLNACTGCSACVIACVAENNIPMVGKTQVARNREMFWIRTDRYFSSRGADDPLGKPNLLEAAANPKVANMPVPCMQCENAPCESVCPVAATTHSPDGLNDMVYNRCIGTRYCSNNCPYKVRKFNYLDYLGHVPDTKQMAFNPDVTVRSRGVMEKCTYCVQRINGGRIHAKAEGRKVRDGEIRPACAQACPTEAITFGDMHDPTTQVAMLRASDLNYGVLSDLNTKPRTTYLGRVHNPNLA